MKLTSQTKQSFGAMAESVFAVWEWLGSPDKAQVADWNRYSEQDNQKLEDHWKRHSSESNIPILTLFINNKS